MRSIPDSLLDKLNSATNELAESIRLINDRMTGRGILPAESPVVQSQLKEIELKLRKIAADKDNLVPFNLEY